MTKHAIFAPTALLLSALLLAGCGGGDDEYEPATGEHDVEAEHHHELGPHGGHLIELTPEGPEAFHAELTFDEKSRVTTIYVLSETGEETFEEYPIEANELVFHLEEGEHEHDGGDEAAEAEAEGDEHGDELNFVAVRAEGEDKTAKFELPADQLPDHVENVEMFHGHVHVTINGEEHTGDVEHDH